LFEPKKLEDRDTAMIKPIRLKQACHAPGQTCSSAGHYLIDALRGSIEAAGFATKPARRGGPRRPAAERMYRQNARCGVFLRPDGR
jgi:hypothetical protein